ncbi:MAG: PepSY-associated TM helix domain-containing protein [Cellvibrionaceae bacterium]
MPNSPQPQKRRSPDSQDSESQHSKSGAVNRLKSAKPRTQRWRLFFWRWHRRVGLTAALVVVLVSITGILLNHTSEIALGKKPVRQAWLLNFYGVEIPELIHFKVDDHWISGDSNQYLYLDGRQSAYCNGQLIGAAKVDDLLVAACSNELILMTSSGEVVERLGETYGLPIPLTAIGACAEDLCLQRQGETWVANLQQLLWESRKQEANWSEASAIPGAVQQIIDDEQLGSDLSWERVVQDLHSGRIFGQWGVWIVDLSALFLMFLSLSGFFLWYQQSRRRR